METIISSRDIKKIYKTGSVEVSALNGVTFDIYQGEFIVILGPSGSGKSTLLNIIGGMDKATFGELFYRDEALHEASDSRLTSYRRRAVGFVFQFYNLMPNLTALENIRLASDIAPDPLDPNDILEQIEMTQKADSFPSQMSGGQQQRIAIARAAVKNPDLLLCDEPTGALDFTTGIQVLQLLKKINTRYHKTVVIITHNTGIAEMADRVFYIKDGLIDHIRTNDNPVAPEEVSW